MHVEYYAPELAQTDNICFARQNHRRWQSKLSQQAFRPFHHQVRQYQLLAANYYSLHRVHKLRLSKQLIIGNILSFKKIGTH